MSRSGNVWDNAAMEMRAHSLSLSRRHRGSSHGHLLRVIKATPIASIRLRSLNGAGRPYRGENPAPGKDVHGELDPTPGIGEHPEIA
jgi:hypothetical protein